MVTISTGTLACAGSARNASTNWGPVISGMFQSVTIRSARLVSRHFNASRPSPASNVSSYPSFLSALTMIRLMVEESSTTSTRILLSLRGFCHGENRHGAARLEGAAPRGNGPSSPAGLRRSWKEGETSVARLKVLVVEDEPVQLKILTAGLAAVGFDVVVARDGVQAVGMVRKEQPALVLLDIGLPGGDGYVVLQRLKALSQSSILPVIAVSARAAETERDKMLSMGADDYFQKPVSLPGLVARINELLAVPQ